MAEFLTTSGISYHIEQIILGAKKHLVLVSPYLQLSRTFHERLKDASKKGIRIIIVYGKDELKAGEMNALEGISGIELYFSENLHAKCYFNENTMVITSMNMYEFSEKNNREMGVLIKKEIDEVLYKQATEETFSIVQAAKKIYLSATSSKVAQPPKPAFTAPRSAKGTKAPSFSTKAKTGKGYCIRCEDRIPYNPERPYCSDCFSSWARYENYDYEEMVCHKCGDDEDTTMDKPECYDCYKSY